MKGKIIVALFFVIWAVSYALLPFGNHVIAILAREENTERGIDVKKTFFEHLFFYPSISSHIIKIKPINCRMSIIYQEGIRLKRYDEEDSISATISLYTEEKNRLEKSLNEVPAKNLVLSIIDRCVLQEMESNPERLATSVLSGEADFVISLLSKGASPTIPYKTKDGEDIYPLDLASRLLAKEEEGSRAYKSRLKVYEALTEVSATKL